MASRVFQENARHKTSSASSPRTNQNLIPPSMPSRRVDSEIWPLSAMNSIVAEREFDAETRRRGEDPFPKLNARLFCLKRPVFFPSDLPFLRVSASPRQGPPSTRME